MDLLKFLKKKKAQSFEELLKKAADEPSYRPEFIKRILTEKLVVITKDRSGPEGFSVAQVGTSINIRSLPDGSVPVFTSKERIFDKGVVKELVNVLECKGEDLFNLIKGAKVILNPYSDYGKEFNADEIQSLLNGSYFGRNVQHITVKKPTKVSIGQPAKYPTEMVKSLAKFFSSKSEVVTAYMGWIQEEPSDVPPHYILAIKVNGNWENINREAGFISQQFLGANEFVDVVQITEKGGPLKDYFVGTIPFYSSTH